MRKRKSEPLFCPACKTQMEEGYMPTTPDGIFFFPKEARPRINAMAQALPGTSSWLRYARMQAWRCPACNTAVFKFGKQMQETDDDA